MAADRIRSEVIGDPLNTASWFGMRCSDISVSGAFRNEVMVLARWSSSHEDEGEDGVLPTLLLTEYPVSDIRTAEETI